MRVRMAVAVVVVVVLQGCALFSKKDRPVDRSSEAPDVSTLINAVQRAIDVTAANPNWQGSPLFLRLQHVCKTENEKAEQDHQTKCDGHYSSARAKCAALAGPTAVSICGDYLRQAALACGTAPSDAPACAAAKQVGPITLPSAKLTFSAAAVQDAKLGVKLKLINPSLSRKYGRTSSFEIELIPEPVVSESRLLRNKDIEMDELSALLVAALNTGTSCSAADNGGSGAATATSTDSTDTTRSEALKAAQDVSSLSLVTRSVESAPSNMAPTTRCRLGESPQLIFKGASYALDISYETKKGAEATWSISSLKLVDGTVGISSSKTIGNVLTIELGRQ